MRLATASPSPVPAPADFVVKKGSKILGCTSSAMPGPSSLISSTTRSSAASCHVRTISVPRPLSDAMACSALISRFNSTCLSCWASANTGGRPVASASIVVTFETRWSYDRSDRVSRTTWFRSTSPRVVWCLRANVSRLRTILAARSASPRMMPTPRPVSASSDRPARRSDQVRIVASGLFSSCATPDTVWPSAASFSFCSSS